MKKTTEKDFYEFLIRDIVQNYFKNAEKRNVVVIQNAEPTLITKICGALEHEAKEKGKLTQKIEAAELRELIEPADEIMLIIKDPDSRITCNGRMKDKSYHINVNELIRISHSLHQQYA
ncbi:MAG: hypothetical protein ABIH63_02640 [archaeon]